MISSSQKSHTPPNQFPPTWEVRRLRFVANVNPSKSECRLPPDAEVPFVPMESIGIKGDLDLSKMRPVGELSSGFTYFREGDVLVAKITPCFENGKGAVVPRLVGGCGFGTTELHVLRPVHRVDARFLYYVTVSHPFRTIGTASMYGAAGQQRVGEGFIRDFLVGFPPVDGQRRIAEFLDRKTAAIDELIRKKERLIELLQEKRQALITQAVTKGLDPSVSMKQVGIGPFQCVPRHWAVKRLKFVSPRITVGIVVAPARLYTDAGVPCPRSLNIKPGQIATESMVFISAEANREHSKSIVRAGDLLCVRTGQPGTTAVVDESFDGANCIDLIVVGRSPTFSSDFLCYFMNSSLAHAQYDEGSEGALQRHFNVATAANLLVPVPPLNEQIAIAAHLQEMDGRVGAAVSKLQKQIECLREYRQALITAAVTGKLEVA